MLRLLLVVLILAGCGGGGGGASPSTAAPAPTLPSSPAAQVSLLFFGNSHTSVNGIPQMVLAMVKAAVPTKTIDAVEDPVWMSLEDRDKSKTSLELLHSRAWKFVVLQAQDYSSSGAFLYPIDGAVDLVKQSRALGALPIMFPEWPRQGINETQRIYDLHLSIARQAPACVPPIPQAWDLASARYPDIVLWNADGNHSAPAGAFLAALIIATTMTGVSPSALPDFPEFATDVATQKKLRATAAETVLVYSTRTGCPADPVGL